LAEGLDCVANQPLGLGLLRHVGLDDDRITAGVADLLDDGLGLVDSRDAVDGDFGPITSQALCDGLADTARTARHDGGLALELHGLPPGWLLHRRLRAPPSVRNRRLRVGRYSASNGFGLPPH